MFLIILYIAGVAIFGYTAWEAMTTIGPVMADKYVMEFIRNRIYPHGLGFMKLLDKIGGELVMIPLGILLFIYFYRKKSRKGMALIVLSMLMPYLVMEAIKQIIQRPRPPYMLIKIWGYSFPSGHSTVSTSFFLTSAYMVSKMINDRLTSYVPYVIAGIYALMMGFSRIYLGVHWPSDVICGWILGMMLSGVSIRLIERRY